MRNWIRNKIKKWLGIDKINESIYYHGGLIQRLEHRFRIDIEKINTRMELLTNIGVDVHLQSPTQIIIFSKVGGGQMRIFETGICDMKNLTKAIRRIQDDYGTYAVIDARPGHKQMFKHELRTRG